VGYFVLERERINITKETVEKVQICHFA